MQDSQSQPDLSFLEAHLKYLMEDARRTPKLQLERAVGPLLTHFIARAMSGLALSPENVDLAGRYRLICCEFPLKKAKGNQSTNVDWLLFNETASFLVFLELKTDANSVREEQMVSYWPYMSGASDFAKEISDIAGKSRHPNKYKHLLKKLVNLEGQATGTTSVKLVCLAPSSASIKVPDEMQSQFRQINFSDLPESVDGPYFDEWAVVRRYLLQLDHPPTHEELPRGYA